MQFETGVNGQAKIFSGLKVLPFVGLAAAVGLAACSTAPSQSGEALYRENCQVCHGRTGAGDGPYAGDLPVAPANLRLLAEANDGVFPTEQVMVEIYGYRGKDLDALMPEFGPILDSPQVIWTAKDGREIPTPSALVALTAYLETLQD